MKKDRNTRTLVDNEAGDRLGAVIEERRKEKRERKGLGSGNSNNGLK